MKEFAAFLKKQADFPIPSGSAQDRSQGKIEPAAPTVLPVTPDIERVAADHVREEKVNLDEVEAKLKKAYDIEDSERERSYRMSPFWYACSQVLNSDNEKTRQIIGRCNLSVAKKMLDDAVEGMDDLGYRMNARRFLSSFDRENSPIDQTRNEIISTITELTGALNLDSAEDIGKKMDAAEGTLDGLKQRISYGDIPWWLHPASFNVIEGNKPEWDSPVSDKLAWIVFVQALVPYMQKHYSEHLLRAR